MRRLIHIFKSLRDCISLEQLKPVYVALCQSIIQYCIPAWGGAGKTLLLTLERAQRAVLKTMIKKPYRYPTGKLYSDCKMLTVRQLFVLKSTLRRHRSVPCPDPGRRSKMPVCPSKFCRTSFARKQFVALSIKIYNELNKKLNIGKLNRHDLKNTLTDWLLTMNYTKTEELLTYIA